jgi:Zn-dependent membrane protease YugP
MYFDPTYFIFVIPPLLLGLWAQMKVKGAYAKWTQVRNQRGLTGLDAANVIIPGEGLQVSIEGIAGQLTDNYDPRVKKLRLSQGVAQQPSVAALAIVAHELGHALQDSHGYGPLKLRGAIVPAVRISSWVGPILFFVGLLFNFVQLAWVGVFFFGAGVVFALITLPVELNASRRALGLLQTYQLADGEELRGAKSVLDAAALTYIAAAIQSLATMLYYLSILNRRRN